MAFDIAPALTAPHRTVPRCGCCPVSSCPAHCAQTADAWQDLVSLLPPLRPGHNNTLMNSGDALPALYTVRAGCIKSYTIDSQGNEHVRAFFFPGDLVGLEALGKTYAVASAVAVTHSQVCAVPVAQLLHKLGNDPKLAAHLLHKTRDALELALAFSGEYSADQRVAAFLLFAHARIGSENTLLLPMTRREIGSYLRLATETVCRALARFEQKNWLACADKRITLLNIGALRELAEPIGV